MKWYQGEFFRAIEDSFGTRVLSPADVYTACYAVVGAVNKNQDPFLRGSVLLCNMNKDSASHCS